MAITAGQLKLYLTGGAANANPALSLGGVTSSVEFIDATLNDLFASILPAEAAAGATKYRALTFKNTSAETAFGCVMYISTETTSGFTTVEIAFDAVGTQAVGNEDTSPSGLSFSVPLSLAAGISLGDIPAGGSARVWFKRIVTAGATVLAADTGAITFTVGSGP